MVARVEIQLCPTMYNCCKSKALTARDVTQAHPKALRIGAGNGEGALPMRPLPTQLCPVGEIHPGKARDKCLPT